MLATAVGEVLGYRRQHQTHAYRHVECDVTASTLTSSSKLCSINSLVKEVKYTRYKHLLNATSIDMLLCT